MSFSPTCNHCLETIQGGEQGFLLSCGHFICHGCCRGTQPSACPRCGSRARAAVLDNPPADVRDYLKNPLTQLKAANDVVMFQLEHFRSAARQASEALHELRLIHSREVERRKAAEEETQVWRQRAEAAEAAKPRHVERRRGVFGSLGSPLEVFVGRGGSTSVAAIEHGEGGAGTSSPIGKLRQRYLGPSRDEKITSSGTAGTLASAAHSPKQLASRSDGEGGDDDGEDAPRGQRCSFAGQMASPRHGPPGSSRSNKNAATAVARASLDRSIPPEARQAEATRRHQLRPPLSAVAGEPVGTQPSFSGTPPPARPLRLTYDDCGKQLDTPQLAARGHGLTQGNASPARLRSVTGQQQQQQQQQQQHRHRIRSPAKQRPETPGRPLRPAWQSGSCNDNGNGKGKGSRGLASTRAIFKRDAGLVENPQISRSGSQASSPLAHREGHHQRRPQRPMTYEGNKGGAGGSGGGETNQFSCPSPLRNVQERQGTPGPLGHVSAAIQRWAGPSPRSPLLGVRPESSMKRPSSGGLPAPKRQGHQGEGTTQQGRARTPVAMLRPSSCSPQVRSSQLPFTPRSKARPSSGRRPWSNGSTSAAATGAGKLGGGQRASSVPPVGEHPLTPVIRPVQIC